MRTKFRHFEDRGRCNIRTGGGQGGDRAAGSALGSPAANVTERVANDYVWPIPFSLEMESCGFSNAR
jgi:hypothetical protein